MAPKREDAEQAAGAGAVALVSAAYSEDARKKCANCKSSLAKGSLLLRCDGAAGAVHAECWAPPSGFAGFALALDDDALLAADDEARVRALLDGTAAPAGPPPKKEVKPKAARAAAAHADDDDAPKKRKKVAPPKKRAAADEDSDSEEAYVPKKGEDSGSGSAYSAEAEASESSGGDESESDEPRRKKARAKKGAAGTKPKKDDDGAYSPPKPTAPAKLSAAAKKAADKKAELASGAPSFAARASGITQEQWDEALAPFAQRTGVALKNILQHNKQLSSGVVKAEQVARCAECALLGVLPLCPLCGSATLRYDEEATKIACELMVGCPGHFSTDRAAFFSCSFVARSADVERRRWRSLEEAAEEGADAAAAAAAAARAPKLAPETEAAIAAAPDARAAADAMVAAVLKCRLSVPTNPSALRQEVAAALLARRKPGGEWDPSAVLAMLAEKYPPSAPAAGAGGGGGSGGGGGGAIGGAMCAANEPLAAALSALSKVVDDHWKRNTYDKAARAVRLWSTPIKAGKELSEGPKKVAGIGQGCKVLIDEFLATGTLKALQGTAYDTAAGGAGGDAE